MPGQHLRRGQEEMWRHHCCAADGGTGRSLMVCEAGPGRLKLINQVFTAMATAMSYTGQEAA
jgi:hypothetical protein